MNLKWETFLTWATLDNAFFLYEHTDLGSEQNSSHMKSTGTAFLQYELSHELAGMINEQNTFHSVSTCKVSLQCESSGVFLIHLM